jgi:hypothetical protein
MVFLPHTHTKRGDENTRYTKEYTQIIPSWPNCGLVHEMVCTLIFGLGCLQIEGAHGWFVHLEPAHQPDVWQPVNDYHVIPYSL